MLIRNMNLIFAPFGNVFFTVYFTEHNTLVVIGTGETTRLYQFYTFCIIRLRITRKKTAVICVCVPFHIV